MQSDKWIWIITGPNGSGKTSFAAQMSDELKSLPYINPDTIAKDISISRKLPLGEAYLNLHEKVMIEIERYQESGQSFVLETTAPGVIYSKVIIDMKLQGWKVGIIALGVSSLNVATARINNRCQEGGHNVLPIAIETFWRLCLKNTPNFLKLADAAFLYDNSGQEFREIASRSVPDTKLVLKIDEKEIDQNNIYIRELIAGLRSHGLIAPPNESMNLPVKGYKPFSKA
jgi:predicted ABC-type ATPase